MIVNGSCQERSNDRLRLIWKNPDDAVDFEPKTIPVNSNCPAFLVVSKSENSDTNGIANIHGTNLIINNTDLGYQRTGFMVGVTECYRDVKVTNNGLEFGAGRIYFSVTDTYADNNGYAIPCRIYESY